MYLELNPSIPDTNGTEESVHISEVSLLQGFNHMQELFLGKMCSYYRGVLLRDGLVWIKFIPTSQIVEQLHGIVYI